ncbi:hypothetical protein Pfo_013526 [Paulownia fortunei]|nr:hypothetical protein Pfo_013526 [Paulownia fortunei]
MASKSLLLLGLLFAVILVISSDVVSARKGVAETKGDVQVDGWHHEEHHHHHCHYPHCREEGGHEKETDDQHEEAETETTKSTEAEGDGHHKEKCKHWPHC